MQEPRPPSKPSTWMAGAQALAASSALFTGALTEQKSEEEDTDLELALPS